MSPSAGPVVVSTFIAPGVAPPQDMLDELEREGLRVTRLTTPLTAAPTPGALYLVWPDVLAPDVDSWPRWTATVQPVPGLVGCVVRGPRALAELALAAGFDDFVVGPVSGRELAARLRAVHRRVYRPTTASSGRLRFGSLTLDIGGHALWVGGVVVPLTLTELALMRALIRAGGRTLSRTELLDGAWGEGEMEVSERAVDNVILRLRRKLPRRAIIQTVRGVGFRMGADA